MTEIVTPTPEVVGEIPTVPAAIEPIQETPVAEQVAPAETPFETPKEPTILGETKPIETPKEEIKEIEGSQSVETAPLPTYDIKAPEGFEFDAEKIGDFAKNLAEFEGKTKADHAEVQALGQSLIDRHVTEVKNSIDTYNKSLLDAFEKQKNDWRESFKNDPEIGGNRENTTISAAREFIRTHGGTAEQQQEFHQLMETTGVGNHPAMIRMLAKAMSTMSEGKPLPANRPVANFKSKLDKMYGGS